MGLLLTMLPVYLMGNLHCIGMCGPLVMLIGRHQYRNCYFLGRMVSFSLAGLAAGLAGGVLTGVLLQYQIPAITSFIFGGLILLVGVSSLFGMDYPGQKWLAKKMAGPSQRLSMLLSMDKPLAMFLFGFFTIMLPCGQTLLVFSACALAADPGVGLLNGFVFALLTSPSLWFAMRAQGLLAYAKRYYNVVMGVLALFIGGLAIARGLAELDVINHLVLNEGGRHCFRIVVY